MNMRRYAAKTADGRRQYAAGLHMGGRRLVAAVASLMLILTTVFTGIGQGSGAAFAADTELRGVWVPTVLSLNYPSKATTDPEALKNDAIRILDNAKALGFNAIFFQVRPASDALYKSAFFPWSKYLTGTQGLAPAEQFDPLAFMIQAAHERGMQLHAWLNPYRITSEASDNTKLAPDHPALAHPDWTVVYDGKMYWNPGEPGVRQLIADGVREIVNNYNVDGIHIDDYFYPGQEFNDAAAFAAYGGGLSLADWRRANTETTVSDMYNIVHSSGKNMVFGVSPMGIWANIGTSPLGSNTRGGEAYTQKYADTRGWVKRGLMDYIAPQIYWNIGFEVAEYVTLVDWWSDVAAGTGVKLYIGQAAYRTGNPNRGNAWYGVSELKRQLDYNRNKPGVAGYIMYTYNSFIENSELYKLMQDLNSVPETGLPPAAAVGGAETNEGTAGNASGAGINVQGNNSGSEPANQAGQDGQSASVNFSDIGGHWAAEYISALAETGVIHGYPDGKFLPNDMIKRADFVVMLTGLFGLQTEDAPDTTFIDIAPNAYYRAAVGAAQNAGIITGIGDKMFAPDEQITRQDMMTISYRALVSAGRVEGGVSLSSLEAFADRPDIADYAAAPVAALTALGFVNGNDEGMLEPLKPATRAETAAIIYRFGQTAGR
ncbi:MAG: family 10 glycosylhydrolase [Clostridiales Family XIII bacterium]|jgi:uncharacterized lipoprotein YddW (UPF0748 family)|nr:family 10 glycosylhydrolase [Clostridiales Family XIII bacterium]